MSLFEAEEPKSPPAAGADPDRVRRKLEALLEEARNAGGFGLPQSRRRFIETVVPQMVRWLPDHEAEDVRRTFQDTLAA